MNAPSAPGCVAHRGARCTIDIRYAYPAADLFVVAFRRGDDLAPQVFFHWAEAGRVARQVDQRTPGFQPACIAQCCGEAGEQVCRYRLTQCQAGKAPRHTAFSGVVAVIDFQRSDEDVAQPCEAFRRNCDSLHLTRQDELAVSH